MAEIRSTTVLHAVYDLTERHDRPPSAQEIADYLEADKDDVLAHLRELQRKRIFRERRRRSERVWTRWDGAR